MSEKNKHIPIMTLRECMDAEDGAEDELLSRLEELEKQVENMKCCGNCTNFKLLGRGADGECPKTKRDCLETGDRCNTWQFQKKGRLGVIEPTHTQMCKEFCELNGIHWVNIKEWQKGTSIDNNPTFSDAASVLEVMMVRDDYNKFMPTIAIVTDLKLDEELFLESFTWAIKSQYTLEKDKLLAAAVQWCREHPKKGVKIDELQNN